MIIRRLKLPPPRPETQLRACFGRGFVLSTQLSLVSNRIKGSDPYDQVFWVMEI